MKTTPKKVNNYNLNKNHQEISVAKPHKTVVTAQRKKTRETKRMLHTFPEEERRLIPTTAITRS